MILYKLIKCKNCGNLQFIYADAKHWECKCGWVYEEEVHSKEDSNLEGK